MYGRRATRAGSGHFILHPKKGPMRARPQVLTMFTAAATFVVVALVSAPADATPTAAATPSAHVAVRQSCATPASAHTMRCFALLRTDVGAVTTNAVQPNITVSGYGPADLASAYKLSS